MCLENNRWKVEEEGWEERDSTHTGEWSGVLLGLDSGMREAKKKEEVNELFNEARLRKLREALPIIIYT